MQRIQTHGVTVDDSKFSQLQELIQFTRQTARYLTTRINRSTRAGELSGIESRLKQIRLRLDLGSAFLKPYGEILRSYAALGEAEKAMLERQAKLNISLYHLHRIVSLEKGIELAQESLKGVQEDLESKRNPLRVGLPVCELSSDPLAGMLLAAALVPTSS